MRIIDFLDRPIAFHRCFVTITSSVTAALMLSQAFYWSKRTKDESGWFHKSAEEWTEETGLTRHEQEGARAKLRELSFWEEQRKDAPAKLYFRLNIEKLEELLAESVEVSFPKSGKLDSRKAENKISEKRKSEMPKSGKQDTDNSANKNSENRETFLLAETTTETTTKTSSAAEPFNPELEATEQQAGTVDELANLLRNLHGITDKSGHRIYDQFQSLGCDLESAGASLQQVESFWEYRTVKPQLHRFVGDFVTWRASQQPNQRGNTNVTTTRPAFESAAERSTRRLVERDYDAIAAEAARGLAGIIASD